MKSCRLVKLSSLLLKGLPSLFTSANLFCGFLSIIYTVKGDYKLAAWLIIYAMLCDVLDGRVARITRQVTDFGAELDSLADMVSFGMAPALLIYYCYLQSLPGWIGIGAVYLYVLCGAFRLARFNIMPAESSFYGLPIPGGAGFLVTLILFDYSISTDLSKLEHVIAIVVVVVSLLMISRLVFPAWKKTRVRKTGAWVITRLMIAVMAIILLKLFPEKILFLVSSVYLMTGFVYSATQFLKESDDNIREIFDAEWSESEKSEVSGESEIKSS